MRTVITDRLNCSTMCMIAEGLEYFDNDVRHCFALSTAVDTTNSAWKQAQLSLSRGGLGLHRLSEHSSACYIASLSMAGMCSESNRHLLNAINQFNEHVSNEEMVTLEAIRETPCRQIGRQHVCTALICLTELAYYQFHLPMLPQLLLLVSIYS